MNWATAIVLLIVAALVIVAIRALRTNKNSCCGDKKQSGCAGCSLDCPFRR